MLNEQTSVPFTVIKNLQMSCLLHDKAEIDWTSYYVISQENTDSNKDEYIVFHAERYGGRGLRTHGGGVRCGTLGKYQIKGIGANQLLGEYSDFWYAHGAVHMAEAIKEFIWGSVLNIALPFGAVPVHAVIDTNLECWARDLQGVKVRAPRALVLRDAVLRPAHFMRSIYFRPLSKNKHSMISDSERTRQAIESLPSALRSVGLVMDPSLSDTAQVRLGLHELLRRIAIQFATAQSKRIMHCGICASNIALDGAWLDYGSVTALPTFSNTENFHDTFWSEWSSILKEVKDLCFYIRKYFPTNDKTDLPQFAELAQMYSQHHSIALHQRFFALAGFPKLLWDAQWFEHEEVFFPLAQFILNISCSGRLNPFAGERQDLTTYGDYDLAHILLTLTLYHNQSDIQKQLSFYLSDEELMEQGIEAYRAVAQWMQIGAKEHQVTDFALQRLCALNIMRSLHVMSDLYEPHLNEILWRMVESVSRSEELRLTVTDYCQSLLNQVQVVYTDAVDMGVCLWKNGDTEIGFNAVQNACFVKSNGTMQWLSWQRLFDANDEPCFNEMHAFFQSHSWDILKNGLSGA